MLTAVIAFPRREDAMFTAVNAFSCGEKALTAVALTLIETSEAFSRDSLGEGRDRAEKIAQNNV